MDGAHPQRHGVVVLSYFTDRFIINPRLLYFVQADVTGASVHLETCSKAHLDWALGRVHPAGSKWLVDNKGPFVAP